MSDTQQSSASSKAEARSRTGRSEFRDHIATVDAEGKRVWLYPRQPTRGKLYRLRSLLSYFQLLFLFSAPFIKLNGHPLIMMNIIERKFSFFGLVFWPQDLHIFALSMIAGFVAVILFTAVFGRVWCGWLCPQTVFMEMLFRRIEYAIEGDYMKHRKRDAGPMTADKFRRKALKFTVFGILAFVIGNVFLAYIIGGDALLHLISDTPSNHVVGLSMMIVHTILFFWMYASFREQFCTLLCPYARLQSVLLDNDSIGVAYDDKRGEPRTRVTRQARAAGIQTGGDCIDCDLCVKVCPTGIDIRNGTPQLECINCTNCIDACNAVMKKVNRPTGLIRYTSRNTIDHGTRLHIKPRTAAYAVLLVLLLTVITTLIIHRGAIDTTLLRLPGQTYVALPDGSIRNMFNVEMLNKEHISRTITFKVLSHPDAVLTATGGELTLAAEESKKTILIIDIPPADLISGKNVITIGFYEGDRELRRTDSSFIAP